MASTGSSFDALIAGIKPNTIPIVILITEPKKILLLDKKRLKPTVPLSKMVSNQTINIPKAPPIKVSIIDSNKN